ncbi:MAG: Ni/Fe hydrogenase subunit beta [Candidatus Omnitrophica bacterium]|nr:Ni/Fe hydrogenase subunit beta [Candidatus Omnitrophota bacterium]
MRYVYLAKDDLGKFIDLLKEKHRVVAPVKKENLFVFADISGGEDMSLEYIPTIIPPKKYIMPQKESLGKFDMGEVSMKDTSIEMEPTVIFGMHTCDIDGLECLDVVFHKDPADPYYKKRRKNVTIIGYECMFPCDEYATCVTMDTHVPKAGYDIMMTDAGDKYILHVNSKQGDAIIGSGNIFKEADQDAIKKELKDLREKKLPKFKRALNPGYKELQPLFEKSYNNTGVWDDVGRRCVSCGNCTAVCPTCYCFDVYDDVKLDMSGGERGRVWDSCQLNEFAEVAGGENFREERSSRQRHRYYRKFDYPVRKHDKFFCTGCGRCTRTCMAKISLIETVNDLAKGEQDV